jgi:hypothetical protein
VTDESSPSILELIRSGAWSHVLCTSYALSLSFFEAVILNDLAARATPLCRLLIDTEGVRAALEEFGPQHAGRMYEIAPVSVDKGCFHPKIVLLANKDDAHLIIGSGNLTFSGWGRNLECFEHLHASFSADAFRDMSDFFRQLTDSNRVRHSANEACLQAAEILDRNARTGTSNDAVRVLHNLQTPLITQIADIASSLGGATRVAIASPYYDQVAVPELCRELGVTHVLLHSHPGGTVEGDALNWPLLGSNITQPVQLDWLSEYEDRPLHAKLFEIICQNGRLLVSGSANATRAAMLSHGNIEVCTARIERDSSAAWSFQAAEPQIPRAGSDEQKDADESGRVRVLAGRVEGVSVKGRIIDSFPSGLAQAAYRLGSKWELCGSVQVDTERHFNLLLPSEVGWGEGQIVMRLVASDGVEARGILSQPEFGFVIRRLGASARSFIAFLRGMNVSDDMAAVISYFQQHPEDLLQPEAETSGGKAEPRAAEHNHNLPVQEHSVPGFGSNAHGDSATHENERAWGRLVQDLIAALTNPSTQTPEDESELDEPEAEDPSGRLRAKQQAVNDAARRKVELGLSDLFNRVVKANPERVNIALALALLQYAASETSIEPSQLKNYFDQIMAAAARRKVWQEEQSLIHVAYLLLRMQQWLAGMERAALSTRRNLLRCGCEVKETSMPELSALSNLWEAFTSSHPASDFWRAICSSSTTQEDAVRFLQERGSPVSTDYPALSKTPCWDDLHGGLRPRMRVYKTLPDICMTCGLYLAHRDRDQLRQYAVIKHSCGDILICTEI